MELRRFFYKSWMTYCYQAKNGRQQHSNQKTVRKNDQWADYRLCYETARQPDIKADRINKWQQRVSGKA